MNKNQTSTEWLVQQVMRTQYCALVQARTPAQSNAILKRAFGLRQQLPVLLQARV